MATNMNDLLNWNIYNQMLVDRGDVTLYVDPAILNNGTELRKINKGKRGRPYKYSNGLILAAYTVKCLFRIGYREASGLVRGIAKKLGSVSSPVHTEIHDRISKLKKKDIKFNIRELKKGEKRDIAIDSTGIREINGGEYRTFKYGERKGWIKLHVSTDKKTKEILTEAITKENVHDQMQYKRLVDPIVKDLNSNSADKGYDANESFKHAKEHEYDCYIPVRINATTKCGPERREAVREQFGLPTGKHSHNRFFKRGKLDEWKKKQQKKWKKKVHYGDRWIVEGTFSRFKGMFGEGAFSKKRSMKNKEILLKIGIYNSTLIT